MADSTALVAAGVVPSTPLLVPAVAGSSAGELAPLRDAVREVLQSVVDAAPDTVVVLTVGQPPALTSFGVPAVEGLPRDVTDWLARQLSSLGREGRVVRRVLAAQESPVPPSSGAVALLLVGDGSIRHRVGGPGGFDDDAAPCDAMLRDALSGPVDQLAHLDHERLQRQGATLGPLLRALASTAAPGGGAGLTGTCRYAEAPYGVGYFAASWVRGDD